MTTEEYIKLRKQHLKTMYALRKQQEQLQEIRKRQSWWIDFSSNLAGNAVWDGLVWVVSRLLRKL